MAAIAAAAMASAARRVMERTEFVMSTSPLGEIPPKPHRRLPVPTPSKDGTNALAQTLASLGACIKLQHRVSGEPDRRTDNACEKSMSSGSEPATRGT